MTVELRARRFDATGSPVGDDFVVNTTTAGAQGQPSVAGDAGASTGGYFLDQYASFR